ncbi:MAG: 4-oxalocrotonate tautomerase [Desulfobacterales bacterium GWB2_56_26]|nr:MAG: 4-oxalocrotonate tautomerase [Desulfobacterales bacterium GWB2_56_26]
MPLVTVTMLKGKPKEFRKSILNVVHTSLLAAFKIPDHDRSQRIIEIDPDNYEYPPGKSDNYLTIEMTIFLGRSIEAKRTLYQEIVTGLKALGITSEDILIVLQESPLQNWGIRGGYSADQVDMGFKLDV